MLVRFAVARSIRSSTRSRAGAGVRRRVRHLGAGPRPRPRRLRRRGPRGLQRAARAHPPRPRRPDARRVLRRRRRRGRDRDLRRVPARAQRVRHRRQDARDEPARGRASPARSRRRLLDARPARASSSARWARAPGSRRSARSPTPSCATATEPRWRACIAGGVDVLLIETVYDLLQAKAAINGARAAMRAAGVLLPLMVQVTVETTGRMLVGSRDRRRAHRARGDAARRHRHELRDRPGRDDRAPALPRAARAHLPLVRCRTPGCRRSSTATPTTTSRPTRSPTRTSASSASSALNIVGGCCGTTPEHLARGRRAHRRRPRAGRPHARARARLLVDLLARAVPPGARVPRGRRAHQRQRLAEVPRRDARSRLGHVRRRWRASR